MNPDTGEIKQFSTKAELEDATQRFGFIPLRMLPKPNCNVCHGRGYSGYDVLNKKYIPCRCTFRRNIDGI
jgi:hypothetical protein